MSWFDSIGDKAGGLWDSATKNAGKYWDDAMDTGGKLLDDIWEDKKEELLSDRSKAKAEVAAHPQATPNNTGKAIPIAGGIKMNWQAAGVVVGALGVLATVVKAVK